MSARAEGSRGGREGGRECPKNFRKYLTVPKLVAQCQKYPIAYLFILSRTLLYLYALSRTITYLNTLNKNPNPAQNQIIVGSHSESSTKNLVSQSESSIIVPKNTRKLSARGDDPFCLSATAAPRWLAIAYLNT